MRCLEKDPKRRPSSAAELEALCNQQLVEHAGVMPSIGGARVATPPPMAAAALEPARQHPRTTALPSSGLPSGPSGRHVAAAPPHMSGHPGGTMVLPESGLPPGTQGLPPGPTPTEWPREYSLTFRDDDTQGSVTGVAPRPAGPLFWIAWALLGVGGGLAAHFWIIHRTAGG
jgi:hypothetical protein